MVAFASRIVCHQAKPARLRGQLNSNVRLHMHAVFRAVCLLCWALVVGACSNTSHTGSPATYQSQSNAGIQFTGNGSPSCLPSHTDYPSESIARNEQGTTGLRFFIDSRGVLTKVDVVRSSGFPRLDDAAIKKLSSCRFTPGRDPSGQARSSSFDVQYIWKIQ